MAQGILLHILKVRWALLQVVLGRMWPAGRQLDNSGLK
jgi:hypothetical protein